MVVLFFILSETSISVVFAIVFCEFILSSISWLIVDDIIVNSDDGTGGGGGAGPLSRDARRSFDSIVAGGFGALKNPN